jgi:hypothetical protein
MNLAPYFKHSTFRLVSTICYLISNGRMNRGRKSSAGDPNWHERRSLTPTRPVHDLVQTFDRKSERITRSSSSSSSSSEDESQKVQVIVVEKRDRPRKSSLVTPDRPRQKKQSNVSFAMQVGNFPMLKCYQFSN